MPDESDDEAIMRAAEEVERELEGEGDEDDEDNENEEPVVAPRVVSAPPPAAQPPGIRTRMRKRKRNKDSPGSQTYAGAEGLTPERPGDKVRVSNDGTKNISLIWTELCTRLRDMGLGPDAVWIRLRRYAIGPTRTPENAALDKPQIDGGAVAGTESVTPGEDLVQFVTDVYHFTSLNPGPARYTFNFHWKSGNSNGISAPEGELVLGDPREIKAQREAASMVARRREMERGPGYGYAAAPSNMGSYRSPPPGFPAPLPQAPPASPVAPALPQFIGASPELEQMRREIEAQARENARLTGIYDERARQEGLRPAPVAGPVETEADKEARLVGAVVKALAVSGLLPTPSAAPAQVSLSQPVVAQTISSPLATLREAFKQMREFREMDNEMREAFAPEEDDPEPPPLPTATPPVPLPASSASAEDDPYAFKELPWTAPFAGGVPLKNRKKDPSESMAEYIIDLGMNNPEGAMKVGIGIMNGPLGAAVGKLLENTAIGKVIAANAANTASRTVEMPTQSLNGHVPPVPTPPVGGGMFGGAKSGFAPKG